MEQIELDDGSADHFLLAASGISLVVFVSRTCAICRQAKTQLPEMALPAARICWVDAGMSGGLVQRYEVFHLPSIFLVRDGVFYGAVNASLDAWDLRMQIRLALDSYPAELP